MDTKANNHFFQARKNLQKANVELFKPEEDVVAYLVCKNSQFAIENNLKGFLNSRGFETDHNETLENLLDRCKSLDKIFNQVDLQSIDCKAKQIDSRYCSDVNKVNTCFEAANNLDTFLKQLKVI